MRRNSASHIRTLRNVASRYSPAHFVEASLSFIQPRNGRVLVERIAEPKQIGRIHVPDVAQQKGILGKVIAVGPGKWIPGEWWRVRQHFEDFAEFDLDQYEWEWIDGYRQEILVRPGQTVYFNSRWNDVEQLPGAQHLIQEADIFCVVPAGAKPATAKSPDLPPLVQSSDPLAHGL